MTQRTKGIHHITAFVSDAQKNVDFYVGILGLRLVKKTINFDAPEVYHLYFGNEIGSPGTAITFFPFSHGHQGEIGGGQVGWTTFAVPEGSLLFWEQRLKKFRVSYSREQRFNETYLKFKDYDGLQLEIVERKEGTGSKWSFGGVSADKAIKGFGGAILYSIKPDETIHVLTEVLGFEQIGEEDGLVRFRAVGEVGNIIDMNKNPVDLGSSGSGTIHHIAWRAKNQQDHERWRTRVMENGLNPTDIVDRQYFKALYFREKGGLLFEIATDDPGFVTDESFDTLGEQLMLPVWFEPYRSQIEKGLLPFEVRVLKEDL